MKGLNRVLCKIVAFTEFGPNCIALDQDITNLLKIQDDIFSSNYGPIEIERVTSGSFDFEIKISYNLAQSLGVTLQDYLEIFHLKNALFLGPISSQNLISHFFTIYGAHTPQVIVLSSHSEFESYTREIATEIHNRLQEHSIRSLRIETRQHSIDWDQPLNVTISRFEVDITRNQNTPEFIGQNLVNKNPSYRVVAELYFQLLSQALTSDQKHVVVDIHGITEASSNGIFHPMVLIGDALMQNPVVKNFTKTIEKASRPILPNLWIPYNPRWGAAEYSLQLVKSTFNIPIIIEIRSDLRKNPETRNILIDLISNALITLVDQVSANSSNLETINYRPFQPEDLNQLYAIYVKAHSWLYGEKVHEHASEFITLFQEALNEGTEGELFVAEQNGTLIGFAVIHQEPPNEWKFGPIAVIPSFQHEGIGSNLLELCINFARSKEVRSFYLKVHEHNQFAIRLYQKFGFTVTEILPSSLPGKNFLKMLISL